MSGVPSFFRGSAVSRRMGFCPTGVLTLLDCQGRGVCLDGRHFLGDVNDGQSGNCGSAVADFDARDDCHSPGDIAGFAPTQIQRGARAWRDEGRRLFDRAASRIVELEDDAACIPAASVTSGRK